MRDSRKMSRAKPTRSSTSLHEAQKLSGLKELKEWTKSMSHMNNEGRDGQVLLGSNNGSINWVSDYGLLEIPHVWDTTVRTN